jgi:cyclopropane fatty-acyl-phospholipid synthase-like methyltransferase
MAFVNDSCDRNEKIFSDAYFLEGKGGYTNYHLEQDLLRERGRSYSKILASHHIPQGKLLDVGCAAGYMMQGFQDCGWQVTGLESNKTMADFAMNKLNLKVVNTSLEDCDLKDRFDVISLIQLIGHLDNPHRYRESQGAHEARGTCSCRNVELSEYYGKDPGGFVARVRSSYRSELVFARKSRPAF